MASEAEFRAERAAELAAERMARKMRSISDQARIPRSQGLVLPELEADPDADDPTTLWVLADGRLCWRTADGEIHRAYGAGEAPPDPEDPGGSTSTKPKPPDPKVVKKVTTYSATWGRTLCPIHGVELGPSLYYGRFSSTHAQRKIMLGLNDSQIRTDLTGATIRAVDLHFRNDHAFSHAGIDVKLGGHKVSSPPGGYSSVREAVFSGHWPKSGEGKYWRPAPLWFGNALRDDTIRGITINQRSDSITHYGAMAWATFKIRITYTVEV